jgi:hypothetical protein
MSKEVLLVSRVFPYGHFPFRSTHTLAVSHEDETAEVEDTVSHYLCTYVSKGNNCMGVAIEGVWSHTYIEGVWSHTLLKGCGHIPVLKGCGHIPVLKG